MDEMNELCFHHAYGVFCIETGNFTQAVQTFNSALSLLKGILSERTMGSIQSPHEDTESGRSSTDVDFEASTVVTTPQYHQIISTPHWDFVPAKNTHPVFRNPLMIPQKPQSDDQLLFVVLYNLALSHHLFAVYHSDLDHNLYRRAQQLWEIVYKLHLKKTLGLSTLHTCAILNNLGNVYKALGDAESCQRCLKALLSAMVWLRESGESECLNDDERFFHSVSQVLLTECRAAPAA
jgi:tetratricopeptide (TPR) repeat protein